MSITDAPVWQELGSCSDLALVALENGSGDDYDDLFFDCYEDDPVIAENTDNLCITCPVAKNCGLFGVETKSWGVWGGVYLKEGRPDRARNAHKTPETWQTLSEIHDWLKI